MTKEELKETGLALIALSEGKADVEYWNMESGQWDSAFALYGMLPVRDDKYRIKPEKKKRLLRPEEMPPIFWIRIKNYGGLWKLPTSISCKAGADSGWAIGYLTYDQVPDQKWIQIVKQRPERTDSDPELWEWSPDRKEVRSFEVEE